MRYLGQKASPWVSASVLLGGMVSAVILFTLSKIQENVDNSGPTQAEEILSQLEEGELY